jgi:hypothetical protein
MIESFVPSSFIVEEYEKYDDDDDYEDYNDEYNDEYEDYEDKDDEYFYCKKTAAYYEYKYDKNEMHLRLEREYNEYND